MADQTLMKLPEQLNFLTSVRFWKLFAVAVIQFLASQQIVAPEAANALTILLTGSVVVRTIDRFGEKTGAAETKIDSKLSTLPEYIITGSPVGENLSTSARIGNGPTPVKITHNP